MPRVKIRDRMNAGLKQPWWRRTTPPNIVKIRDRMNTGLKHLRVSSPISSECENQRPDEYGIETTLEWYCTGGLLHSENQRPDEYGIETSLILFTILSHCQRENQRPDEYGIETA